MDPNSALGPNSWTALHAAAYHGPASLVSLLLDAHADPSSLNDDGHTPLYVAIASHQFDAAEALILRGARLSGPIGPLWTQAFAISSSSPQGKPGLARLLLAGGADPNAPSPEGIPPLSEAIGRGMVDVALVLLEAEGTDVSVRDVDGITPLHYAAYAGHVELGRSLLARGADPTAQVDDGSTPAFFAVEEGQLPFLAMLLAAAPDSIGQKNIAQWSLLHTAVNVRAERIVDLLLKLGAEVDARTEHGTTPLAIAASKGEVAMVTKLLRAGADPNALTDTHASPLHKAALGGHVDVAKVLLKAGTRINVANVDGWTALHVASHENHGNLASLLIEHGASLEAVEEGKPTPLDVSLKVDSHASSHVLLDHSAPLADPDFLQRALANARSVSDDDIARTHVLHRASSLHFSTESSSDSDNDKDTADGNDPSLSRSPSVRNVMSDAQRRKLMFLKAARHGSLSRLTSLEEDGDVSDLVSSVSKSGLSPLFLAISHGHDSATAWLLSRGAVLVGTPAERAAETKATGGATFLHRAILRGEDSRVELLLEAYSDLNIRDGEGNTPAHVAGYMNNTAYLSLLGASGRADLLALNHSGQTPLARSLDASDTFRYLVLHAPDAVNVPDVRGLTPLASLASRLDMDKLHYVLAAGADVTATDGRGYSALHHVAVAARPSAFALDVPIPVEADKAAMCASLLIDAGVDLDVVASSDGTWPLFLAARSEAGPLVHLLIAQGASLTLISPGGKSAYDEAKSRNLAIAAIIEAGMKAQRVRLPRRAVAGSGTKNAALETMVLEWSHMQDRVSTLENENARLRHEMRALRKLVVSKLSRSRMAGDAPPIDLDETIAQLSKKGGKRQRHRRPRGVAAGGDVSTIGSTKGRRVRSRRRRRRKRKHKDPSSLSGAE